MLASSTQVPPSMKMSGHSIMLNETERDRLYTATWLMSVSAGTLMESQLRPPQLLAQMVL